MYRAVDNPFDVIKGVEVSLEKFQEPIEEELKRLFGVQRW